MHVRKGPSAGEIRDVADDVHLEERAAVVDKLLQHAGRADGGKVTPGQLDEAVAVVDEGEGVGGLAAVREEGLGDWRRQAGRSRV